MSTSFNAVEVALWVHLPLTQLVCTFVIKPGFEFITTVVLEPSELEVIFTLSGNVESVESAFANEKIAKNKTNTNVVKIMKLKI